MAGRRRCLWLCLALGVGAVEECEDSSLLALRARRRSASGAVDKVAFAFQGGGFLPPAEWLGLLAGVRGATGLGVAEFFRGADVLSGSSGGVLFLHGLVYGKFERLVEEMAAAPKRAGEIVNSQVSAPMLFGSRAGPVKDGLLDRWAADWSAAFGGGGAMKTGPECVLNKAWSAMEARLKEREPAEHAFRTVIYDVLVPWLAERHGGEVLPHKAALLLQLLFLGARASEMGYASWDALIAWVYEQAYGIERGAVLGGRPKAWAKGKVLTSVVISSTKEAYLFTHNRVSISVERERRGWCSDFNYGRPGIFSVRLGSGEKSRAPLPFCTDFACNVSLGYAAGELGSGMAVAEAPLSLRDFYRRNFEERAGSLPVAEVAAAATAALGMIAIATPSSAALGTSCGMLLMPYVANGPRAGGAFGRGSEIFEQVVRGLKQNADPKALMKKVAKGSLHGFSDGGSLDETSIKQALKGGSREIVLFLEYSLGMPSACDPPADYFLLHNFAPNGNRSEVDRCVNASLEGQFGKMIADFGYTVFSEPSNSEVYKYVYDIHSDVPDRQIARSKGDAQFLAYVSTGRLPVATTLRNELFGIEAGRQVTISYVCVASKDIAPMFTSSLFDYGGLAQEIQETLMAPGNSHVLSNITTRMGVTP